MQTAIHLYDSQNIDPEKWDNCIAKHANGLIYAQYQYLGQLTKHWSAIIIGNYQSILPLPWNTKWGIRYYQAIPFVQQLGLIGKIDKNQLPQILEMVKKFARYGDVFFNFSNQDFVNQLAIKEKTNLVLDLSRPYSSIAKNYKKDLIQNIEKSKKKHPIYQENPVFTGILDCYQEQYGKRFNWIKAYDFNQLSKVLSEYQTQQQCIVREAVEQTTGELLAGAILLKDDKRIYLLINAITTKGRQNSSNHFLIDRIIHEFSESNLLLDFEGSEITGVKEFYNNFQPMNQPYFQYHHNLLPWPVSLFKK